MNKKLNKLINKFAKQVNHYIVMEYDEKYYNFYTYYPETTDYVLEIIGQYYLGGNTVPYTAGHVIDCIRSKYEIS